MSNRIPNFGWNRLKLATLTYEQLAQLEEEGGASSMTTDITELAQRMKAAAEKATPGPWYVHDKPCEDGNYGIDTSDKEFLAEAVVWWGFARQSIWREEDAKYIALANHANVLALVEALEKTRQRIEELESDLSEWTDCKHDGATYYDMSGQERCGRCGADI
ncbi:ead/Ea22-like family protein [Klebsiella pneumoniae]